MKESKLIERLIKQGNPTWEQYNELEREGELEAYFLAFMAKHQSEKKGTSAQNESIAQTLADEERHLLYDTNHAKIKGAILNAIAEKNAMPRVYEIAKATELSRQTVYNHLRNFDLSTHFSDQIKKYQIAFLGIMDVLIGRCMSGDVKAMRLYFEIMAFSSKRNPQAGFLLDRPQAEQPDSSTAEGEGPQLAYTSETNDAAAL